MSILAECPICRQKQSAKNRICRCGEDLVKAKRSKKVKYWISYRLPGGKQRRESIGYSVEEARDAEGKRRSQKRENRIFDMLPEAKLTFRELSVWYLNLKSVKRLASYDRVETVFRNFNKIFGDTVAVDINMENLENYQENRRSQGAAPSTIDMEISVVKTMITKALDNDKVSDRTMKPFRKIGRMLKKGDNARKRKLSVKEYLGLIEKSPFHLEQVIIIGYNTGMRLGEIRKLKWSHIDLKEMFIRLPKEITKERKAKNIPINHHVKTVLDKLPRALKHDFVFTFKGNPIKHKNGLKKSLITACRKAGITYGRDVPGGFIFQDIRRTVKTNMLDARIPKEIRDTILGHSLKGMDVHYLVPSEKSLKASMNRFTGWLDKKIARAFATVDQNVDHEQKRT